MLPHTKKSKMFDSVSLVPIRYVDKTIAFQDARGLVAEVYDQIADEFFMNGALSTHSVRPELLAGIWIGGREIVLTDGLLPRNTKEAIGVSFAQTNKCTYCEDMLIAVVHGAENHGLANDIRFRKQDEITDETVRAFHTWAQSYRMPDAEIVQNPPFDAALAPELLGSALTFNYLNRFVKIFFDGTPLDTPFTGKTVKSAMFRGFGLELRESVTKILQPGRAFPLLPDASLPEDMTWAAGNPDIATAVAQWAGVIEKVAEPEVPANARTVIAEAIANWTGEDMGMSRAWLTPYLAGLDDADTAVARLGLLTAFAPYQVSDDDIADLRSHVDGDGPMVSIVAWSAFTAARRITAWLADAATVLPFTLNNEIKN